MLFRLIRAKVVFYLFFLFSINTIFANSILDKEISQKDKLNVLIAITVHFDFSRLKYLAEVLSSLGTFPRADVILITNTLNESELIELEKLHTKILPNGIGKGKISIRSYGNLAHPFELTWCHKEIIENEFINNNKGYTHFIYLEDDIEFNFTNFCYFIEFREVFSEIGLLPSFLRVEFSQNIKNFVNTDNISPIDVLNQPKISYKEYFFVNPPNPYMACFVLDKELASEYIITDSFDKNKSSSHFWGIRERAAMGLCWEKIPNSFQSRYVVPVCKSSGLIPKFAWISHLPDNYANDPSTPYGKISMDSLFIIH